MKDPYGINHELLKENSLLKRRIQELEKAEADRKRDRDSMLISEEVFKILANNIPDIIYSLDGEGKVVTVNSSAFERYGYSEQDTQGKPFFDFIHPEDREIVISSFLKAIEEQRKITAGLQFRISAANGASYWFELHSQARFDSNGLYIGEDGVLRDITERKLAEMELRESEQKYRELVENANSIILRWSQNGNITFMNEFGLQLFGYTEEEILGHPVVGTIVPENESTGRDLRPLLDKISANPKDFEQNINENMRRNGERIWVSWTNKAVMDGDGKVLEILSIGSDITEHRKAEEQAQNEKNKLDAIIAAMTSGLTIRDKDYRLIYQSPLTLGIFGNHIGEKCYQVFQQRDRICENCPVELAFQDGKSHNHIAEVKLPDGEICFVENIANPIRDASGVIVSCLEITTDITERQKAEEVLRESEARFRNLLQDIQSVAVQGYGPDGTAQYWNQASERLYGYSAQEAIGRNLIDLIIPPEMRGAVEQAMRQMAETGMPIPASELSLMRKDGSPVAVFSSHAIVQLPGQKQELFCIDIDLTERMKAEEEKAQLEIRLMQAHKMEALGTLAGGIAHDFNNILAAIIGYTEMAIDVSQNEILKQYLQETMKGADRAKNLIRQILTFSRQDNHEKKPLDIKLLLKESIKFLRASIPATIEIREHDTDESCNILADPSQVHQIIMNLCTNAAHAMKQTGGIMKIELSAIELAKGEIIHNSDLEPGSYIKLTVSDTGQGIEPAHIHRIFDPFFTTKSKEEGTGLGLSMVFGIVKSHAGAINVYSEPGKGASFNVYLPRIIPAEVINENISSSVIGGTEQILFVDDEYALIDLGIHMLSSIGYEVTGVTSSIEALELFHAEPERFDLVITDMTLPKMTGIELSREIMKIRPDIPIILCSGVHEVSTEEQVKSLGIRAYCIKPLTRKELSRVIRDTLDHQNDLLLQ